MALFNELGENGFPTVKKANGKEHNPVRGPENHGNGWHGHVGPINHIPINK